MYIIYDDRVLGQFATTGQVPWFGLQLDNPHKQYLAVFAMLDHHSASCSVTLERLGLHG
jgi:hypothetical protein